MQDTMIASPVFDPAVHLKYEEPSYKISMEEMGLKDAGAPSHIGVTAPFQLCSPEGVLAMRQDIFQPKVIQKHLVYSALAGPHCQLRGMAPTAAKFVYDFWHSKEVLDAISKAAGCELVPVFDYELGHVNIQVPKGKTREEFVSQLKVDPFGNQVERPLTPPAEEPKMAGGNQHAQSEEEEEEPPLVVGWHRDAYPWVCVLMLSDVANMKGGETAIKKGDGSCLKAIGPQIGSAVMMQGGYIPHAAMPCYGSAERITMVTSFRPKAPLYRDISNLDNIRTCSNWFDLYDQWVQSRLTLAQEKIAHYSRELSERRKAQEEQRPGSLLTKPTVDLDEFDEMRNDLNDLFERARVAMKPYSDPSRVF
ncbi:hypothetical protein IE53DRAFT_197212 [Violaceomyces palustris]|uniref:Uncharacterized protein n=1 Tax=Violaceomyces palustris TaxID=1673888 RepID=A0ACD0NRS1_9BASI|nr:hypothetical protein IE53DRAFT_197212 [Violaceomyces palustris]